jgi:hypothetical protein|tara:strand:- start:317 stop:838 length:522 start_codon:yes stop_codon:yes gene_type:complete
MALSKIDVSKMITGTLAAANGGTGTTSYSPGKIGQVVQVIFETDTDFAASSFQDITGGGNTLAASITPTAATSKVLVTYITQAQHGNNKGYKTQLERAISGGATTNVFTIPNQKDTYGDGDTNAGRSSVQYLDSPSTTSATTYTVMIGTDGAGTVTIANGGSQCMITLYEVLA